MSDTDTTALLPQMEDLECERVRRTSSRSPLTKTAPPSLLDTAPLSSRQREVDERIRTLCLVLCALAVSCAALHYLRTILVRLVLALALKYLLTPLIELLSFSSLVPRGAAIVLALILATSSLGVVGVVLARSIGTFAAHANQYKERTEILIEGALSLVARLQPVVGPDVQFSSSMKATMTELLKSVNVTELIVHTLGNVAHIAENVLYILLFLIFLLADYKPPNRATGTDPPAAASLRARAEMQVLVYIRGKVGVALLFAVVDAALLWTLGLKLWNVFGVVAFCLNFVPTVGMPLSVLLPMPVVLLDPDFGPVRILIAFAGPLAVGMAIKDIMEPLLIAKSTRLSPIAVLLCIMLWGSVWGITGMVLAVPITAVSRIYLAGLEHPLPRYFAYVLSSGEEAPSTLPVQLVDVNNEEEMRIKETERP
mmetsp:Transcript_56579/g.129964  ORF Transcript_56579/g.129964 Transcript_56579/m.129964 type:complete len:426 (-) Transcript_56579:135-1412(-)